MPKLKTIASKWMQEARFIFDIKTENVVAPELMQEAVVVERSPEWKAGAGKLSNIVKL